LGFTGRAGDGGVDVGEAHWRKVSGVR
jgi:hypothetical protein